MRVWERCCTNEGARMKLAIAGVSHKTAPVAIRESLAFRDESLPGALERLRSPAGVREAMILSTCNRVEITLTAEDFCDPHALVDGFLAADKGLDAVRLGPQLYRHECRAAIHHTLRV